MKLGLLVGWTVLASTVSGIGAFALITGTYWAVDASPIGRREARPFDATLWRRAGRPTSGVPLGVRRAMVEDLVARHARPGLTTADAIELLGPNAAGWSASLPPITEAQAEYWRRMTGPIEPFILVWELREPPVSAYQGAVGATLQVRFECGVSTSAVVQRPSPGLD